MDRRSFIKFTSLGAAAMTSGMAWAQSQNFAEVHDVVVIGAGFAGLWAAISAKNEGIEDILILEKGASPYLGASVAGQLMLPGQRLKEMLVTKMIKAFSKKR